MVLELLVRHSNSRVGNSQGVCFFVRLDFDVHVRIGIHFFLCGDGQEAHLVESIRRIRNQLADKDVLSQQGRHLWSCTASE